MYKAVIAALLLASIVAPVSAATYSDCSTPPRVSTGTVWHIDPVSGKSPADGGDGSAAHPWNSLQGVLAYNYQVRPVGWTKAMLSTYPYDHKGLALGISPVTGTRYGPDGPGFDMTQIQPGDTVLLASGNYGSIGAGSTDGPVNNVDAKGATKWITFKPETGATPVFQTLSIGGVRGEIWNGITVRSTKTDGSASNSGDLVLINDGGPTSPTMDVQIANSLIESVATMPTKVNPDGSVLSGWSKADWVANTRSGIRMAGSDDTSMKCVTAGNNVVKYVTSGILLSRGTETTISTNVIDYFAGDAMDHYSASNATWQGNIAEDRVDDGNGTHTDCLQFAFATSDTSTIANPWHDVVATKNTCLRLVHADNPWPGYLQGIWASNGNYSHLTITDNKIVSAACIGIDFSNVTESVVANNSVVRDGSDTSSGCNGLALGVGSPAAYGPPHNLVANNVVTGALVQDPNGSTWFNNVSVPSVYGGKIGGGGASYLWNGTAMVFVSSGPSINGVSFYNYLTDTSTVFTSYNPPASALNGLSSPNLTPAVGGILAGTGYSGPGIPTTNFAGVAFPTPTNIGAY